MCSAGGAHSGLKTTDLELSGNLLGCKIYDSFNFSTFHSNKANSHNINLINLMIMFKLCLCSKLHGLSILMMWHVHMWNLDLSMGVN